MLNKITIGEIATALAFIVALITSIKYIAKELKDQVSRIIDPINKSIEDIDAERCKDYLVRFLADKEKGIKMDEVEEERAYECYDKYTNKYHQNPLTIQHGKITIKLMRKI